ncbi:MAG: penicillin-binding transpeptidase domain-containing protein [Acutalibacteraceae bacterium]|nr:penicillin-binding transpeptidase domain-containing protein [Acutalibacteraceae bacterium]
MAKKGTSAQLWNRSIVVMILIIAVGFGVVAARLLYLQTFMAEELQKRAVEQQLVNTELTAKRGSIYDCNGNVLAQSVTVWDIVMEPANIKDEYGMIVAEGLHEILGTDVQKVYEQTKENHYYAVVKRKVDTDVKDKVMNFNSFLRKEYNIANALKAVENYRRFYTHDNFLADVLGFVGADSQGLAGLEYQYDDYLIGKKGRLMVATNAAGGQMPYEYEQKIDAIDGYNLTLSVDEYIQSVMEKYVRETIAEFRVANRGCAIMMNVKTGAILGFACEGSFNPNDPFEIADEKVAKEIAKLPKDKQDEAEAKARNAQWRNKGVSDTYIPGSVFKMCTASAVLSEGLIKKDTRFECSGSYVPFEGSGAISCWSSAGHGEQTLEKALCNSCNPAFMQMGNMLGRQKFYEYYVAFGFSEPTGIDLPGESDDYFFHNDGICGMDLSDLAVASFGQNFKITPIQMLSACAAIANGGKLMTPYVVQSISDANGNVVRTTEPKERHQAISKDVAAQVCKMLENNVLSGGGTNGYIPGYRIAAKTGTSQKKVDDEGNLTDDYIGSFCGFAPADDPEIALICYFDTPDPDINYYGSAVAGPCFRSIMSEVLPYLGVEKVYSKAELGNLDTTTGAYVGATVEDARSLITGNKLKCVVMGKGKTVLAQNPDAYTTIPQDGTVVLYTEETTNIRKVVVPDFSNLSLTEVNQLAAEHLLNISIKGSLSSEGRSYAKLQDIAPLTEVDPYSVITVTFNQDNNIM